MRDFRDAKAMAHTLRAALVAKGQKITISQSLELIAEAFGVADWNTLVAAIRAEAAAPRNNASPPPPRPPVAAAAVGALGYYRQDQGIRMIGLEATLHLALAHANQRKHQYATLEHLLLALTEDVDASAVMKACDVDLGALKAHLTSYIDNELKKPVADDGGESRPTAACVVPRAVLQAQRLGRPTVSGAELLVAIFAERQSPAALLLLEQAMTAHDAVNFVVHGFAKGSGDATNSL